MLYPGSPCAARDRRRPLFFPCFVTLRPHPMESVTIVCDGCQARIGKAERTRIRWSREPRRPAYDLCPDCRDKVFDDRAEARPSTQPAA